MIKLVCVANIQCLSLPPQPQPTAIPSFLTPGETRLENFWFYLQNSDLGTGPAADLTLLSHAICPWSVQKDICIFPEEVSHRSQQCQPPQPPFQGNWSGRTCLIVSQLQIYFDAGKWGVEGESVGQKGDR